MTTYQYVITTITKFVTVMTYNQMVISTSTGKPLNVDQNPAQKLPHEFLQDHISSSMLLLVLGDAPPDPETASTHTRKSIL